MRIMYVIVMLLLPWVASYSKTNNMVNLREYEVKDSLILNGVFKAVAQCIKNQYPEDTNPLLKVSITNVPETGYYKPEKTYIRVAYKKDKGLSKTGKYKGYFETEGATFVLSSGEPTVIDSIFQLANEKNTRTFKTIYYKPMPREDPPTWMYVLAKDILFLWFIIDDEGHINRLWGIVDIRENPCKL